MGTLTESGWYLLSAGIIMVIFLAVHAVVLKSRKEEVKAFHWISIVLFTIAIAMIYQLTVSPVYGLHFDIRLQEVNLKPFQVLVHRKVNQLNFYGNILMFVPVGVLTVWLSRDYGKLYKSVLFGAGISLSIEILQLFLNRGTDIDDLILNTIGTFLGAVAAKVLAALIPGLKRSIGIRKLGAARMRKKDGIYLPILTFGILLAVLGCGEIKRNELVKPKEFKAASEVKDAAYETDEWRESEAEPVVNPYTEEIVENEVQSEAVKPNQDNKLVDLKLDAKYVYFYNASTGTMLYGDEEDKQIAPASTTKMLTALTALDYCGMNDLITVGDEIQNVSSDASKAGLQRGMQMDVRSMLAALLLPSGNDAAYSLAAYTGRKIAGNQELPQAEAVGLFVDHMNEKAKDLGADQSNFVRPDGYDADQQYTTAYDLGMIAKEFMKCEPLREISGSESMRCVSADGTDVTYRNTDELVCTDSSYYTKEVIGGKTGSSGNAGKCLVSAAMIDSQMYIAVVMGDSEEGRFYDSIQLYNSVK